MQFYFVYTFFIILFLIDLLVGILVSTMQYVYFGYFAWHLAPFGKEYA